MDALLSSLAEACREHLFTPKLLVVQGHRLGHQLLEALAQNGVPWLNVTPVTPEDLALELVKEAGPEQGAELLSDGQLLFLVGETLEEMEGRGELRYFRGLEGAEGLAGILKAPLMELRMAGVSSGDVSPGDFADGQKGREMKALLGGYEKRLAEENGLDAAALYIAALEILGQGAARREEVLYLVPEQLELDGLSFTFLERLTGQRRLILPAEGVRGLSRPRGFYFQPERRPEKKPGGDPAAESLLSWLFDPENAPSSSGREPDPAAGNLEIFQAYGAACEVKEVFRRLKKEGIPLDKAALCYTNGEVYLPLIFTLSSAWRIPATFADGVPVRFTRPGKLFFGLLDWTEENFAVPALYRLFTEGSLQVSSGAALARLLRRAGIGWGRERYLPALEALQRGLQTEADEAEAEEREGLSAHLLKQRKQALELKQLVTFFLEGIPTTDEDECVDFARLCGGLAGILQDCAAKANSWDRAAGEALRDGLAEASRSLRGELPLRAAVKRLKARLEGLRIGASGPEPGCLHAASLRQGEWSFRPHTFLLGLDDGHFPGRGLQDPVLLDGEREALSSNLPAMSALPEQNVYRLARFLASRRDRVTLSFPSFNPAEGRASFPAAALLQAYRLESGNPGADYSAFAASLERPAAYFPSDPRHALSPEEWWGSLVLQKGMAGDLQSVRDCYPGIHAGLLAEEARSGEYFTRFDGRVCVDPHRTDPRLSGRPLSATGIETLAACPFSYFLRYVLRIEPPEEHLPEPGSWLDPLARGLLLHRIYAEYLRNICSRAAGPGPASLPSHDRELLTAVAEELLAETRAAIPPPSPVVYEYERAELLQGLEVFLRAEEDLWLEGSIPLYLEVPFGLGAEGRAGAGQGLAEPVELALPGGGSLRLRGRIDRIDRTPRRGHYRVWDFKTGGTYGFDERAYIRQGRQIQHALYGVAAEEILRQEDPAARVEEAGYLFPTEKGEGERFLKRQDRRREALEALQKMLDLLSAGAFCPTEDADRCRYCDYQPVCRYPHSVERMKKKLSCRNNAELAPWKELQEYE